MTSKLDFDDVYFVKELKCNIFSVSQMCDKKNNVLITDTECIVLSPEFKMPDENQVLLRVPRENNMYNVDLKNNVPSGDLTCLFAKATLDESNLKHRRLGHINFKTMNKLVKGKFDEKDDEGFLVGYSVSSKAFRVFNSRTRIVQKTLHINFLENKPNVAGSGPTWLFDIDTLTKRGKCSTICAFPLWSSGSKNPHNTNNDVAFEVKKPEFEGKNHESEVHVSPSSSAKTKKHDDKTKREAKGKSPVELSTGYRNLSAEFEDFSDNSINEVNAVDTPSTLEESLYVDPSHHPNDSNMPALEDITYSNDEEDVSAEADFTNLKTTITVNDVMRLQALINRKKVIITEATVREALRLDDAESIDCLPNEEIFTKLSRMGLVRNVDSSVKFYMYPRFLQLMIRAQVGDLSSHTTKYSSPAITQKVFANMRRVGKGFSGLETPLFKGMIVAQQVDDVADEVAAGVDIDDVPAADVEPTLPSPTPTTQPPPPSQELPSTLQVEDASKQGEIIANIDVEEDVTLKDVDVVAKEVEVEENADVQGRPEESQAKMYKIYLKYADKVLSMQDDESEPKEKGLVIKDPEETVAPSIIIHSEPKSKDKGKGIMVQEPKPLKKKAQIEHDEAYARELEAELNKNINWDDVIEQVQRKEKEDNDVLRYQSLKRKPQTEAQARKNMMIYLRNMAGFKIDYFKGMSYDDIRPIFEKYFNSNVAFLEKTKEQIEEKESKALKKTSESLEEKAAKKQKLDEEVEELKKHLQIVPNDDDDVYTEATPFALKIVKEIFASSKPKNFSDDFLLTNLTYMFEKPDVQA
nr:ribonuclease H-like domain-containing protein [Tanacetum cinerariifolium]